MNLPIPRSNTGNLNVYVKSLQYYIMSQFWLLATTHDFPLCRNGFIGILCSVQCSSKLNGGILNLVCKTCKVPWILLDSNTLNTSQVTILLLFYWKYKHPPGDPSCFLYSLVEQIHKSFDVYHLLEGYTKTTEYMSSYLLYCTTCTKSKIRST